MGKSLKFMTLTAAIGFALVGAGLQSSTNVHAASAADLTAVAGSTAAVNGVEKYIITFTEAGAVKYQGGVNGYARTAPNAAAGRQKFDANSIAAHAYGSYLEAQREIHRAAVESALGRNLDVTHSYGITFNGIAADLSPAEAAAIQGLPGIESVRPAGVYYLDTYRGPEFIGADKIWDGSSTPSHVGTRGQGVVVGVLDGGTNSTHPSFANDETCGFSSALPKLKAVDCSTSSGGVCNGPNPEANPGYGHGVHTSSTVAGNTIDNTVDPAPLLPDGVLMSGVAPCAAIHQYKVCATNSCGGADITAGIQNAIADGVDAINFSISGGTSPWSPAENDRQFLEAINVGIFVAASAGNTNDTITNPVGQVNHRGPWMTTVAASTHDQKIGPTLWATGPGTPPPATQKIALNPGSNTVVANTPELINAPIAVYTTNIEGCTDSGAFPANYFQNKVALVRRGTCPFTEKVANAAAAGASMVFIANNQAGSINMNTDGGVIPAFSMDLAPGDALIAFVAANPVNPTGVSDDIFADGFDGDAPTDARVTYRHIGAATRQGDVLADFSFRGPTPGVLADLTKPDITGPGVDIYAATDPVSGNYEFMSGTSMSGPHVAGSGALMVAVHPDWTPAEIKSALMMTAKPDGWREDGTTPWNIDDVGSGRVRVDQAALAGLTMNETYANYLAANPSGGTINIKALNIPALRNLACNGSCTWTRKVKNRLATSGTWNVTSTTDPSFSVTASPASFTLAPGAEQTITFTAQPTTTISAIKFGYVNLHEASGNSPDQHISVALKGTASSVPVIGVTPASLSSTQAPNSTATKTLTIANTGGGTLSWSVSAAINGSIWNQPTNGTSGIVSSYSIADGKGGYTAADFQVAGASKVKKIKVFGFDNSNTLAAQSKITWRIYGDASGSPAGNPDTNTGTPVWTYDSAPNGTGVTLADSGVITLDLVAAGQNLNLPAGTYWLTVFPTYAGAIGPAGSPRWNWFQAEQQAGPGKLVGTLFGVNNWTALSALGLTFPDVAFTIDGDVTCGASWLSLSPTSGNVAGGSSTPVTATFNSNGMAAGSYSATACIASNDATNPVVTVPVTMTVESGGGSCNPTQLFKDPSLEQGSTFWTGVDSVFGDPFCDASCDEAGTVSAHTGSMFAWIGGTATAGTGSLAQAVVFPAGQARWLNWWMIDQLGTQATLKITIDNTQVLSYAAGAPAQTWAPKTFQVPAQYLDGQSHTVKFNYAKSAGASVAGVMLDDVTLDCSAQPTGLAPTGDSGVAASRRAVH